jgi:5-methylphenazine-1-carboxylate 1-monooxygenase
VAARVAIIGGGIAGLTAALNLHAYRVHAEVFEQAPAIRELGVGINLLPPAVRCLAELDLLADLDRVAIRTNELILANRHGQHIWRDRRGIGGGHDVPQFSIHRGRLQQVLYDAVCNRLGPGAVHVDRRVVEVTSTGDGAEARFADHTGAVVATAAADIVLGADGIHSTVRSAMYPAEGDPRWNGVMMWRGAAEWPAFLDGRSMIIAGGTPAKTAIYPIGPGSTTTTRLTNWAVAALVGVAGDPPPRREDWSRPADRRDVRAVLERFSIAEVDLADLVAATEPILEYPMCDRDPLPCWTRGRATLIGDAAHPMYPMGSNGGTQSIIDASVFARHVAIAPPDEALAAYERDRRPLTSAIVESNRLGGNERVIDIVERRAPDGFTDLSTIISESELRELIDGYKHLTAGVRRETPGRV